MVIQSQNHNARVLGTTLVIASAVVFSLAGVFTKLIASDAWTIACWRGLCGAIIMVVYLTWRRGRWTASVVSGLGWRGWLLATVGSLASLAFISAFKHSYVANVTVIYATVPFVAAVMEWVLPRPGHPPGYPHCRRRLIDRRCGHGGWRDRVSQPVW